ncbi:hypothetical protein V494_00308 [Pseudogymnoascus sp. VKM F-4513 (FW-928)]|nr:hypothetical protein V494_00308 [Pseudogymnoascus sp. VKM F-4513 (FW-928)]
MSFSSRHIPALIVSFGVIAGGAMPVFNAASALSTLGFPQRVASSQPAQAVSLINAGRNVAIGLALGTLYSRGMLDAVDILLGCWGLTGLVDGTCSTLRYIATPFLYYRPGWMLGIVRILLLIRVISQRPELARHVRELHFQPNTDMTYPAIHGEPKSGIEALAKKLQVTLNFPQEPGQVVVSKPAKLLYPSYTDVDCLLITHCPSLDRLRITVREATQLYSFRSSPLLSLKRLVIEGGRPNDPRSDKFHRLLHQVPNLTHFEPWRTNMPDSAWVYHSNLRKVKLFYVPMDTAGFNSLLDACPKLEWLSYVVEARPACEGEIASITPMEAQRALITKARTLKGLELRLSATGYSPPAPRWLRDADLLLSLKKMTALEKLILDEFQLLVHNREDYY